MCSYILKISNLICCYLDTKSVVFIPDINRKNKHHVQYPDLHSAIKPVPHGPAIPIPILPENDMDMLSDDDDYGIEEKIEETDASNTYLPTAFAKKRIPLSQAELNDLKRYLGLSNESAQLLGSLLHEHNVLEPGTTFA